MWDSEYLTMYLHNGEPYNFFNKGIAKLDLYEENNLAATYRAEQ